MQKALRAVDVGVAGFSGRVNSCGPFSLRTLLFCQVLRTKGRKDGVRVKQVQKLQVCCSSEPGSPDFYRSADSNDAFKAAAVRLQNLLAGVGDGEEEFLNNMLEMEPPETKVLLSLLAGGAISVGSLFICWLCGNDPLGGASLSLDSLRAGMVGALAAIPLALTKSVLWSDAAKQQFPPLEDLQQTKVRFFEPIIGNMSKSQVAIVVAAEVLPTLLMALPAAQGGLTLSFNLYVDMLRSTGYAVPELLAPVLALTLTAFLAAVAQLAEFSVSSEEYDQIKDAVDNSDRYYRLMAMGKGSRIDNAQEAAVAFKAVALTWLARRRLASRVAAMLTAAEIIYLGVLWKDTGDLTAPAVAALLVGGIEFSFMLKKLQHRLRSNGDARGRRES